MPSCPFITNCDREIYEEKFTKFCCEDFASCFTWKDKVRNKKKAKEWFKDLSMKEIDHLNINKT